MDEIQKHFTNKKTRSGHEIRFTVASDEITLWYLVWDELQGKDGHHHLGIATVTQNGSGFDVGWLEGTDQRPRKSEYFESLSLVLNALDIEVAVR